MSRSATEIEWKAKKIGEVPTRREATDNSCIPVLSALIEDLGENVQRFETELDALKAKR